jgi:hypothetical protein
MTTTTVTTCDTCGETIDSDRDGYSGRYSLDHSMTMHPWYNTKHFCSFRCLAAEVAKGEPKHRRKDRD